MTVLTTPTLNRTLNLGLRLAGCALVGLLPWLALGRSPVAAQQIGINSLSWSSASFPVENFQTYTSPYGQRVGPDGRPQMHRGLDLAAPQGSYIRNWWAGRVVEVSDEGNCGTSIVIQSGPYEHIYCHMIGQVEVSQGERYLVDREGGIQIRQGQTLPTAVRIGRVGMTGRTTGPHLHWGMRYSGQWLDPAYILQAMYTAQARPS